MLVRTPRAASGAPWCAYQDPQAVVYAPMVSVGTCNRRRMPRRTAEIEEVRNRARFGLPLHEAAMADIEAEAAVVEEEMGSGEGRSAPESGGGKKVKRRIARSGSTSLSSGLKQKGRLALMALREGWFERTIQLLDMHASFCADR